MEVKDLRHATEQELRDYKVPFPKTKNELDEIILAVTQRQQDYGTCVYAASIAATATFNYVASLLGMTGFQGSCADLDILRRTRHMERFMIVDFADALYPQYNIVQKVRDGLAKQAEWLAEQAQKNLDEKDSFAVGAVKDHWEALVLNGQK